jgi:diaminopimelate decarboxylase
VNKLLRHAKRLAKSTVRPLLQGPVGAPGALSPQHWNLTEDSGQLRLHGVSLKDLTLAHGSPLHVVDAVKLRENAARFQQTVAGATGGCEVYSSYKTNPVPGVLSILHSEGVGAEVISHYEYWLAKRLGVPASKIVYNGPVKSRESVEDAIRCEIGLLNLNHREEIGSVAEVARALGKRARVGLRVTLSQGWTGQFGVPVANGAALDAFREAILNPHLEVVAIHAHRGGVMRTAAECSTFVQQVLALETQLREELGHRVTILNFGGSLGTPTVQPLDAMDARLNQAFHRPIPVPDVSAALSIEQYLEIVVGQVQEHARRHLIPRPRIFLEPGRAMTANTQMLLCSVHSIKRAGDRTFAIMDAGINHAETVRGEYHQLLSVCPPPGGECIAYTVVGPICTPGDTLYPSARLPELSPGDVLAIMDSGAYFVPFGTAFSFPRPAIVQVDGGGVTELRRAERFEDLIGYDNLAIGG